MSFQPWHSSQPFSPSGLYERLLEKNADETKSGAGQYFTPRPLIASMAAVVKPRSRCSRAPAGSRRSARAASSSTPTATSRRRPTISTISSPRSRTSSARRPSPASSSSPTSSAWTPQVQARNATAPRHRGRHRPRRHRQSHSPTGAKLAKVDVILTNLPSPRRRAAAARRATTPPTRRATSSSSSSSTLPRPQARRPRGGGPPRQRPVRGGRGPEGPQRSSGQVHSTAAHLSPCWAHAQLRGTKSVPVRTPHCCLSIA